MKYHMVTEIMCAQKQTCSHELGVSVHGLIVGIVGREIGTRQQHVAILEAVDAAVVDASVEFVQLKHFII